MPKEEIQKTITNILVEKLGIASSEVTADASFL